MRVPANSFEAADLALCRAHSDAVANEPDFVLWNRHFGGKIAAQEAALDAAIARSQAIIMFQTTVCVPADPPLPPTYWDDLEDWLKTLSTPRTPVLDKLCGSGVPAPRPPGTVCKHSVCVKAYTSKNGTPWAVGQVVPFFISALAEIDREEFWLPCDKDGWVTHVPTADSACPVPPGVRYQDRLADGEIGHHPCWHNKRMKPDRVIVAWRPVAEGCK